MDDKSKENIDEVQELMSYIVNLEQEKETSISSGNYEYTEELNTKIKEIKNEIIKVRKKLLQDQHNVELESLNVSYKSELQIFNDKWEEAIKKFEEKSKQEQDSLAQRHSQEMEDLYNYLEHKIPKTVKFSKKFLDLKNQEENLVKLQKFKEAAVLKKQLDAMEKADTEKFNKDKYEKIKSQSVKTANKHMSEKTALKKKIDVRFEVLQKDKQKNYEQLLQKYNNRKTELDNQQKQEISFVENENLLKKKTTTNKLKNKKILSVTPSDYNGTNKNTVNNTIKASFPNNSFLNSSNFKSGKNILHEYNNEDDDYENKNEHMEAN